MKLLWWMTHEGQKYAEALQYARALPGGGGEGGGAAPLHDLQAAPPC